MGVCVKWVCVNTLKTCIHVYVCILVDIFSTNMSVEVIPQVTPSSMKMPLSVSEADDLFLLYIQ